MRRRHGKASRNLRIPSLAHFARALEEVTEKQDTRCCLTPAGGSVGQIGWRGGKGSQPLPQTPNLVPAPLGSWCLQHQPGCVLPGPWSAWQSRQQKKGLKSFLKRPSGPVFLPEMATGRDRASPWDSQPVGAASELWRGREDFPEEITAEHMAQASQSRTGCVTPWRTGEILGVRAGRDCNTEIVEVPLET